MARIIISLCFALAVSSTHSVSAGEPSLLAEALTVLLGDDLPSPVDRLKVANGFAAQCRELNRKIPALSPREADWVEAGLDAGRIDSVYVSLEFAKRQSKRTFDLCSISAETLALDIEKNDLQLESYRWATLLSAISDWTLNDHMITLRNSGELNITEQDRAIATFFRTASGLMIRKILTPFLRLQLVISKGKTEDLQLQ